MGNESKKKMKTKQTKKNNFQREIPSSECNTFLSTLHFEEHGKKTIKLDGQVDQKKKTSTIMIVAR